MVFVVRQAPLWILNLQIVPGMEAQALSRIDAIWERLMPDVPVDRNFIVDRYAEHYRADAQRGRIFADFSLLASLIMKKAGNSITWSPCPNTSDMYIHIKKKATQLAE